MSFDFNTAEVQLNKKISELQDKPFLPGELVDLISRVAKIQLEAQDKAVVTLPDPSELTPADANLQGSPLLMRNLFPYDYDQACGLFTKFSEILAESQGSIAEATNYINNQIKSGELTLEEAFKAYLESDDSFFAAWGEKTPEAPRTLNFLVQSSLTPSIKAAADGLLQYLPTKDPEEKKGPANKELDLDISLAPARNHGHCPVCGSIPFIHSLHHKQGFRYASCSFCHTEYRVRRLACSYCDEGNPEKLKFFTVEDSPGYRVDVCESCKNYMKTVDFRELDKTSIPALDDLESLPLDFVAVEEGYRRGTLSVWGF